MSMIAGSTAYLIVERIYLDRYQCYLMARNTLSLEI